MASPAANPTQADLPDPSDALLAELVALPRDQRRPLLERQGGRARVPALADAADRLHSKEVSQALDATAMLVELADDVGTAHDRVRARRARIHALAYGGRCDQALTISDEAVGIADVGNEPVEGARAMLAAMQPLCLLGRTAEAIAVGERARDALVAAGEKHLAARADLNLANVERTRGNPRAALERLDAARTGLRDDPLFGIVAENSRGEALMLLDEFGLAEEAYRAALARSAERASPFYAAIIEGNIAELLGRQGRLHEAAAHFEAARRGRVGEGAPGHQARLLIEQAEITATLGLPHESLAGFNEGIALATALDRRFEIGRGHLGRAQALMRLRRLNEAEASLTTAAECFVALGNRLKQGIVALVRGELLLERGDIDRAEASLADALSKINERPLSAATAEHHLAVVAFRRGRLAEAIARTERALAVATQLDVPTLRADILHLRGEIRRASGHRLAAIADLREAVAQVERVRGSLAAQRLRAAFFGDRIGVYRSLVQTLIDGNADDPANAAAAFEVAEQAKSRSLLDLLHGAVEFVAEGLRLSDDPHERSLAEEIVRVQRELNALYSQLGGESIDDQRRVDDVAWHRSLQSRERRLGELETRLASTSGGRRVLAPSLGFEQVRASLDDGCALVEYFMTASGLVAWIVRRDAVAPLLVRGFGSLDELVDRIAKVQFQIARALRPELSTARIARLGRDCLVATRSLHDVLVRPLEAHVGHAERLVIVPHGALHLVPFHALHDGREALIDRHEITVAPSASIWSRLGDDRRRGVDGPAVVIGVHDLLAPQIADEARRVARQLERSELLLDGDATVDRALAALASARIAHVACHGRFSPHSPLSSGLRLHDRWLTPRDLQGVRLRAKLVTLSACDSGRSMVAEGDELLGLVRAFIAAGVDALVVSHWTIGDGSTAELMTDFYARADLDGPAPRPAAALREAQLAMRERRSHPVHWAPFMMIGRP